jgi:hypothetical protein
MKSVVREIASLVIGLTGVVLLGIGLNHVLDIGTCASGGPYAITRPCPEGATGLFWMSFAGAIMWMSGIILSRHTIVAPGAGQLLWTAGFAGGGAALLIKVFTQPSMPPDARLGASIVAAVFLPMGLVMGVVGLVQLIRQRRRGSEAPWMKDGARRRPTAGSTTTSSTGSSGRAATPRGSGARWRKDLARAGRLRRRGVSTDAAEDSGSRLKALNRLRSTGALTRAEFDALKVDLAGSGPDGPQKPASDRVALIRQLADQRASGALSTADFEARKRSVLLDNRSDSPGR